MSLRQILRKYNMTQSELARQLGVTRQQVFFWCRENTPYKPSKKYQMKIAEILGDWKCT